MAAGELAAERNGAVRVTRIGWLTAQQAEASRRTQAMPSALADLGYVEGEHGNPVRYGDDVIEPVPDLAAELVRTAG